MFRSFFGGVSPAPNKESTRRKPIARLDVVPNQVVIPMNVGENEAVPLVKVGDPVRIGQPIALCRESAYVIHASVSGKVAAVEDRPHPWGGQVRAVVLDNDGQETWWDSLPEPLNPDEVTLEQLLRRLGEAGVLGMGGGAFPTRDKLAQAAGKVDTLIVNAAECEPYITADHRLLLERSSKILLATRVVARVLGVERTIVVTEGDKLNAAEAVERRLLKDGKGMELRIVATRYPQGAEKQIIQAATRREVPPGGGPLDVKCVVLNVATLYAVHEALIKGRPLTRRVVTVTGGAVVRPRNLWVPIGTPLACLLESCGGLREKPDLVLTNGVMMGIPQTNLEVPVVKSTNALICLTKNEHRLSGGGSVCIQCGKCVAACPMHLAPAFINRALEWGQMNRLASLHPEDCMECGCCSYICPARIPLLERVGRAREVLKKGGDGQ